MNYSFYIRSISQQIIRFSKIYMDLFSKVDSVNYIDVIYEPYVHFIYKILKEK